MKQVKTVILGGSCLGVGGLLNTQKSLLIERSASIGGEYFDAYKSTTDWDCELQTALSCEFRKNMESRHMVRGEQSDFYGLAPLIYYKLKEHADRVMLMTELAGIDTTDDGYQLTVYDQSGRHKISCEEIIDTSVLCVSDLDFGQDNIEEKRLNAIIYNPGGKSGSVGGIELEPGRNDHELFLRVRVGKSSGFPEAREKIIELWEARSPELKDCLISSIAKEFDYDLKSEKSELKENWQYLNPVIYANPLQAIDAGIE